MTTLREGSRWRRWDPHVHIPGTVLNDNFGGRWDEFLSTVESVNDIVAIGVTDYMTIDSYTRLLRERSQGRIPNIDLLFPNIEFRLAPPTDKGTAVNVHLLIDPSEVDHEAKVLQALGRLYWDYAGQRYSCLPDQLRALGRATDGTITSDRAAMEAGVLAFKIDFDSFRNWRKNEPWLAAHSLVAVDAGKDGLSGFRKHGAWGALRDEVTRFAQVIFSGRPGEREFWLCEEGASAEEVARLGGPRPCIHGSDAHEMSRLFRPDADRFCWIKGDATFEGLRQILHEPKDRIHIGPTPPSQYDAARVIRRVRVTNSKGWFDERPIDLSPGLVSIIGQKGSGKSGLAELIAYAAGSWKREEDNFIDRAGTHLAGAAIELEWGDGHVSRVVLHQPADADNEVRFLSQAFVERLCRQESGGKELVREIETVVFNSLDVTETLSASDFEALKALKTEASRAEGTRLHAKIGNIITEEFDLREKLARIPEKEARAKALAEEKAGLAKQMPEPATPDERKNRDALALSRNALVAVQQEIARDKGMLQRVADIRERCWSIGAQLKGMTADLLKALATAGITTELDAFELKFGGDVSPILTRRETALKQAILDKEGMDESPAPGTAKFLAAELKRLEALESADKEKQQRLATIQARMSAIDVEYAKVKLESEAKDAWESRRTEARKERLDTYEAYFVNLARQQESLSALYEPMQRRLGSEEAEAHEKPLRFSIRCDADIGAWLERGAALFDGRKTMPHGTFAGLEREARACLLPAWNSGDPPTIRAAMEKFLEPFRAPSQADDYLRSKATARDLFRWLFEVEHVQLRYGLRYNDVELHKLSPGTKGIVLLILYLGLDSSDTRPLIVDQPDENLDNESIYALLSKYFRNAKQRRQVVLITHNPNLVVNSDSEQVVVAKCDRRVDGMPSMEYESGALESRVDGQAYVREHVCRLLEGGRDAFNRRERRYSDGPE